MNITLCSCCDHMSKPYKSATPRQWLCLKHKKASGFGFVTNDQWDDGEPYARCYKMNFGMCPLFMLKREKDDESQDNQDDIAQED